MHHFRYVVLRLEICSLVLALKGIEIVHLENSAS